MGAPNLNPFISRPDVRALFDALKQEIFAEFNCHEIGVIQSFDSEKQSAQVRIVVQRAIFNNPPDGNTILTEPTIFSYPALFDVPVIVLGGGSGSLQFPIAVGDGCLLLFNDRDLDLWWVNGTTGALPNSYRMHSINDGVALVGLRPEAQALTNYDTARVRLVNGSTQIALGDKVRVSNVTISFLTILNQLITALDASVAALSTLDAVKTGGSASSAIAIAQAAVNTLQTQIPELFET